MSNPTPPLLHTICAPACPPGGALSIIRISGPEAHAVCEKIIHYPTKKTQAESKTTSPSSTLSFALIKDKDNIIDEVLVSVFFSPKSYTGEDMVEISCHGSRYIVSKILELLVREGAVLAKPGEFSQRAFLNGKMDLSQAEAVADLIASETRAAHHIAMDQMRGGFSTELKQMRQKLLDFASLIELELDFSEEDVEFANRSQLTKLVGEINTKVTSLLSSFRLGNVISNGLPVAIVGAPNVGKSTLLNRLFNEEKAIVSEIAGTTRDVIEDTIDIEGLTFRFIDTAGIRESADVIENLGIRKTYQKIEQARIVMLLADARDSSEQILAALEVIRKQIQDEHKQLVLLVNKTDLADPNHLCDLKNALKAHKGERILYLSAKSEGKLDELHNLLVDLAGISRMDETDVVISNARHADALQSASAALERVLEGLSSGISHDLIAQDIREVLHFLGEITGEVTTNEILGNIFSKFCIGK
jgi:tRNA modification GTPase